MKKNLISIGKLSGEGCVTTFVDKTWKVSKATMVIEKGEKVGMLYLYKGISNYVNALTSIGEYTTLWHYNCGHMSEKGMQILHLINLLLGLKHAYLDLCENYVYGKHKRFRFIIIGKEKKSEKLDIVHTNVWGLAHVSSLSGSHYYVTFIDYATRKT